MTQPQKHLTHSPVATEWVNSLPTTQLLSRSHSHSNSLCHMPVIIWSWGQDQSSSPNRDFLVCFNDMHICALIVHSGLFYSSSLEPLPTLATLAALTATRRFLCSACWRATWSVTAWWKDILVAFAEKDSMTLLILRGICEHTQVRYKLPTQAFQLRITISHINIWLFDVKKKKSQERKTTFNIHWDKWKLKIWRFKGSTDSHINLEM